MFLKSFPKDVPLAVVVQQSFIMLQSTLMRVQELLAEDATSLSDEDRRALRDFIDILEISLKDALELQKRLMN